MSWAVVAIGAGVAIAGAGTAISSSAKASTPPDRQLGHEIGGIDKASTGYLEQQKKLSDYQVNTLYPQMLNQELVGTAKTRQSNLQDLHRLGPKYQLGIGEINPNWQKSLNLVNDAATHSGEQSPLLTRLNDAAMNAGPTALSSELQSQALKDLLLGRSLSAGESRDVQQSTRAGYADRGLINSNPAMFAEALNRDRYATEREAQRRQFAEGVQGLTMQELGANRAFQGNVENQNQAFTQNRRSFLTTNAELQQNALAPALGFLGQRTDVPITAPASILAGSSNSLQPLLGYGEDLYNTNYNAAAAANIANMKQKAATGAGLTSLGGSVAGAGMCWVAREIYGSDSEEWVIFKNWLVFHAPRWFHNLYLRRGERFAAWLHNKPRIKALLRPWFDARVARMRALAEIHSELSSVERRAASQTILTRHSTPNSQPS